jgi:putative hydrolase of the HAD superfamily
MIHLSKPGKEIFDFVLNDSGLDPAQTLFIDDTLKHVETARLIGINGYHLDVQNREEIMDLFA